MNSQEYKSFEIDTVTIKISMTEYHHLINCQTYNVHCMVYSNTAVYEGNEYDKSGHLSIFTSLKHVMVLLRCKFFRASFLHLVKDTDSM